MVTVKSIWQCRSTQDARDYYKSSDWRGSYHSHLVFGGPFTVEVRLQSADTPWSFSTWHPLHGFTAYNPDHHPITPFYGQELRLT